MANIYNHNFHNLKLQVNKDEYWDIFLNKDSDMSGSFNKDGKELIDDCLISYIDARIPFCTQNDKLTSTDSYIWKDAIITPYILENIGYTGCDNGLITFKRDRIDNSKFIEIYTKSKHEIKDDKHLSLHRVDGSLNLFEYPLTVEKDRVKLNGGFYQGFIKTECGKYEILPTILHEYDTWHFEFTLNKTEFEKESEKTLNDKYPNNKGIFFYLGTRAENKWVYTYKQDSEKDECLMLGVDDYVENGEIRKEDYKISNFTDMSLEMPQELGEIFIDDYITFKYYSNSLYERNNLSVDLFLDDYLSDGDDEEKPNLIDENNNPYQFVNWCCNNDVKDYYKTERIVCPCGCCKKIIDTNEKAQPKKGYLSNCTIFGDDYISDLGTLSDGYDYFADDLDISNFTYETIKGFDLKLNQYMIETDNKFLLFDRTCNGFTTENWEEGSIVRYFGRKTSFKGNLFLLMDRTCHGYTTKTIDALRDSQVKEYDWLSDLFNNALAFRITDDGEIGYRYFEKDCESEKKYKIHEAYSFKNIIKENEWVNIHVVIKPSKSEMKLYFYVNGNLVFLSDSLPKLNLRELNEPYEKQEGVPFNMSIGGGTQGLAETVLPNYMLDPYRTYPLEEYFAGSFIGYFRIFRFYNCSMEYLDIYNNYLFERQQLRREKYL